MPRWRSRTANLSYTQGRRYKQKKKYAKECGPQRASESISHSSIGIRSCR